MSLSVSGSAPPPALAITNLTKSYGSFHALRGISLQVAAGECVSIFGPNGAGKSTLLRILAEITRPTSGEIFIHGQPLRDRPLSARRQLGVIGHQTFLYDDLTAAENLQFFARLYDVPARHDRVRAVLAEVGLDKRAHDRVRAFSRGMQQRLAIARAMVHDPGILFLDEPYTGLDQHAAGMLTQWLQKLRSARRTILLVTHDLQQGLAMADRAVIFLRGRLVWEGATAGVEPQAFQKLYFDLVAKGEQ
ncbi:MAG: heme ABC exporter ATP-binding protein CcmA [candidate division KSB1 bacterium]|nr:heme ABC exporter ATP-binding protein CcmA [candidate division KSB1 bacterium]MDZ7273153.1 heme ABC exporter ATP-binding protein CcmA [candidate division KSB1 bacterium]MDZ7285255.1 heme ABC exporter ATP-binding protein CcmA [candidate division KSB1 bacterium]MDZ7298287.1 heme ABC exporter ATP-binding protein CcmA [candidate division KSB1 bacterium]MDZ7306632.1 heme ABC exporter ATP-binding protein CcmA [candidate division KSB1 bacterium]